MKGELSGGVGPVFAGVADPIGSGFVARPGATRRSQVLAKELVALEPDVILSQATPAPMTTLETAASRCIFCLKSLWSWRPLRPASWQVLARRERAAAGRGA